jgi:hypothetical protein
MKLPNPCLSFCASHRYNLVFIQASLWLDNCWPASRMASTMSSSIPYLGRWTCGHQLTDLSVVGQHLIWPQLCLPPYLTWAGEHVAISWQICQLLASISYGLNYVFLHTLPWQVNTWPSADRSAVGSLLYGLNYVFLHTLPWQVNTWPSADRSAVGQPLIWSQLCLPPYLTLAGEHVAISWQISCWQPIIWPQLCLPSYLTLAAQHMIISWRICQLLASLSYGLNYVFLLTLPWQVNTWLSACLSQLFFGLSLPWQLNTWTSADRSLSCWPASHIALKTSCYTAGSDEHKALSPKLLSILLTFYSIVNILQMLFLEFINEFCGTYVAYYLAVYSYISGRLSCQIIYFFKNSTFLAIWLKVQFHLLIIR